MCITNSNHKLAKIDLTGELSDQMCQLYMSDKYSDVVFVVENQRIPAHKYILAVRNQYFESLLYGGLSESKQKEIELKVPLEAFNALLRYVYSGQMCLSEMKEQTILDILFLTNTYGFTTLEVAVSEYLKEIVELNNVCAIFNVAWLCDLEGLKEVCCAFMDRNASDILAHESFNFLSKEILQELLRRDSFIAPELQIFTAVSDWCKYHRDVDTDSVISYIRLPLMNLDEILKVLNSGIVKLEKVIDAMERKDEAKKLPYRVWPGENMAAFKFGSQITQGVWRTDPTQDNMPTYDLEGSNLAEITAPRYNGILVELGIPSIINNIKFMLSQRDGSYSYFVEVSVNQSEWEKVADYRDCHCQSMQKLYFPPRSVKYIKLVGTRNVGLTIVGLRAMYTESIPKLMNGFKTGTVKIYGTTTLGGIEREKAIFNYMNNLYYDEKAIIHQLSQPYYIGSLKLYLWDTNSKAYNYNVEISTNKQEWWRVVTKKNETALSWQTVAFPPCPVVFIKIVMTINCSINSSRCIFIEEEPTSDEEDVSTDIRTV